MLIPEGEPASQWAERLDDIRRWTVMPRAQSGQFCMPWMTATGLPRGHPERTLDLALGPWGSVGSTRRSRRWPSTGPARRTRRAALAVAYDGHQGDRGP